MALTKFLRLIIFKENTASHGGHAVQRSHDHTDSQSPKKGRTDILESDYLISFSNNSLLQG